MIRAQKSKITFAQAMIFLWVAALIFGTLLLIRFVYKPFRAQLGAVEEKVFLAERQSRWLGEIIDEGKDPERVTNFLTKTTQELGRKFPETEQRSLVLLSEYAHKFRVQMTQIESDPPEIFRDSRGREVVVDQKTCLYVYTRMKMKADYVNFIKYLEVLNKVLPAYVSVEKLEIEDRSPAVPRLEVNADLALYLLER